MVEGTHITELPLDVLLIIFPHLDAKSFLAFCSTCKAFQQPLIRSDPAYWSFQIRSTFRVPNQPVVQHDGDRWQKLYRRLFTQTRLYTWGDGGHNRLGHGERNRPGSTVAEPKEFKQARDLGIVVDVQCGGWSTTMLNSSGKLYMVGVVNGEQMSTGTPDQPGLLSIPLAFGSQASSIDPQKFESTIKISQFSAGRSHILGLSDCGRVWSWDSGRNAVQVTFDNLDLVQDSSTGSSSATSSQHGVVRQVIAGWSHSSAYVQGVGIVVWKPLRPWTGGMWREERVPSTMQATENIEIPKTSYRRPKGAMRESDDERILGEEVGAVGSYILLEHFVVFVTDVGKVFCSKLEDTGATNELVELTAFRTKAGTALDVQGSFRRFAIFKEGDVFISDQEYLDRCWENRTNDPGSIGTEGPQRLKALQHDNIVSVAFGDYHYLALHSSGRITTYGTESRHCGALGLGRGLMGRLRGLFADRWDTSLPDYAHHTGRQVWFSEKKREWLSGLLRDSQEASARLDMFKNDPAVQREVSEWIEQEARTWDEQDAKARNNSERNKTLGEDGLSAHFALRISAAGWHAAAVLLVNDEIDEFKTTYDWENKSFPRLRLSDGREMEGSVPFDAWPYGRPDWLSEASV